MNDAAPTRETIRVPWAELNWGTGTGDPQTWVLACITSDPDDYDIDGLTSAWMTEVNAGLRSSFGAEVFLGVDGTLVCTGSTSKETVVGKARRAVRDVSVVGLAPLHNKSYGGPYRVEITPLPAWDTEHILPAGVYVYEYAEGQTPASVIEDAKNTYSDDHNIDPANLRHRFLPMGGVSQPAAPTNRAAGVNIRAMNALDLLHRTVVNPNGVEFHVARLELEASRGTIIIWLVEYDEDGDVDPDDTGVGIESLAGWTVV